MQRHHETTCKERADSISHIEVTENMPTNVECENRMPSYCVDVCIYPEPNVEATIMFKQFKLGQRSVYLHVVDSSAKLKLLLFTEAFKVKLCKRQACLEMLHTCESILAFIETYHFINFTAFMSRMEVGFSD